LSRVGNQALKLYHTHKLVKITREMLHLSVLDLGTRFRSPVLFRNCFAHMIQLFSD